MQLVKLTSQVANRLINSTIYYVSFFIEYLDEIYDEYPQLPMPAGIIDSDISKQGIKSFRNYSFEVLGWDILFEIPVDSVLVISSGYYREEYEKLIAFFNHDVDDRTIFYYANKDTKYYEDYLERYKNEPLHNLLVFRSGMGTWEHIPGMDYTENSRALFEYLVSNDYNNRYEMIWLVKYPENYSEIEDKYPNVTFISYDWATSEKKENRDSYYRAICLAKFFFFTHGCGFCRLPRAGQIRVQLWHGCGFKTVNNSISFRNRYEYTTVISKKYADIHMKEFGLDNEQMLITGYAKEDWLFHPVLGWRERLGISKSKITLFWLPTFRVAQDVVSYMNASDKNCGTGLPMIDSVEKLEVLNDVLKEYDAKIVVKLHPLQKDYDISGKSFSNICFVGNKQLASAGLHINEILGDADALLSDYSSAAVDYLLLDRPIGFVLDDLDEYKERRGFVLNPIEEWLPGEKIMSFEDLLNFVKNVCKGEDISADVRNSIKAKLHAFGDDKSCKRIADAMGL